MCLAGVHGVRDWHAKLKKYRQLLHDVLQLFMVGNIFVDYLEWSDIDISKVVYDIASDIKYEFFPSCSIVRFWVVSAHVKRMHVVLK